METSFAFTMAFLSICSVHGYTAIQVRPITFTTNLESQVLLSGDDLTLICNISLSNDLPVFLRWRRHNNDTLKNETFQNNQGTILSELKIKNVSVSDEGVYECLVWDGNDETAPFVTVTNSAQITVIDISSYSPHGVINEVKSIGEYILLPCNITENVGNYDEVIWEKNGKSYPANMVLKSGNLIIHNLTVKDEGTYRCSARISRFSKSFFNGVVYNLSLSANETSIHPKVVIDPIDILLASNEKTSISCCLLGLYDSYLPYELTWFQRNISGNFIVLRTNITEYCNQLRLPLEFLEAGSYEYMCGIVIKNISVAYNSSFIKLHIQDLPMIDDTSRISDKPLGSIEDIECPLLSGSNITYKWYKNGVHVSDSITLSLTEEFVGIYQCFVENSVGCDYAIIRILDAGFANPPENFTCKARNQSFVLQWNLPNFNTTPIDNYAVFHEGQYFLTTDTFKIIPLEEDANFVDFWVYVLNQSPILVNGTRSHCQISSTLERVTSRDSVKDITLNCPTNTSSGNFSLDNPSILVDYIESPLAIGVELEKYHLLCKCLHKNVINMCGDHYQDSSFKERVFLFDIERQPSGSLCLIGGMYVFEGYGSSPLMIPPKTCKIPASPKSAESPLLNLSCDGEIVSILINEPDSTNTSFQVDGHCILSDITTVNVSHVLTYANSEIIINHTIPEILVCSFVAYYHNHSRNSTEFEYLQCVMDKHMSVTVELATTSNITVTTTTSTAITPISTFANTKKSIVFQLVQALVGVMLILSVSLLLILLVCLGQKKNNTSDNEVWQKAVETVSEESEQKEIVENLSDRISKEDTISVITIFEQLRHSSKENDPFLSHRLKENDTSWSVFIYNSLEKPLYYLNGSNSSGYETESEYFVADDSK